MIHRPAFASVVVGGNSHIRLANMGGAGQAGDGVGRQGQAAAAVAISSADPASHGVPGSAAASRTAYQTKSVRAEPPPMGSNHPATYKAVEARLPATGARGGACGRW